MAKTAGRKKPHDNGLRTFHAHMYDAASKPVMAALRQERAAHPAFAFAPPSEQDPETAAKAYLDQALASDSAPGLAAPVVDRVASEFKSIGTEALPLTGTTAVRFRQTLNKIPVYGSLVTVELDENNDLLGINSAVGTPKGVSPMAKVSAADAAAAVRQDAAFKADVGGVVPRLNYFFDVAKERWHLAFIFEDVPVSRGTAKGPVPVKADYVVDAHTGRVVAVLPRTPTVAAAGVDCLGATRTFEVTPAAGGRAVLADPVLNVRTFDFRRKDPETQADRLPGAAIGSPPAFSPSAVSAHANASDVSRFMRATLMRNNIDGAGGPMVSSINCIQVSESVGGLGREWLNAFWNGEQMVYGLRFRADGSVLSLAADLDVVAHEMTHGVTDRTARLEYRFQSGALNESYSDIFGVIVNNFAKPDQGSWNWEIGAGLLPDGKPFRDFSDPPARGQPAHMRDFVVTSRDHGGVHANSGIHNKAAYNVLVSTKPGGGFLFTPREAAVVFYLALTQRLSQTSQFADSRAAVVQSARTFFRALPAAELAARVGAIEAAFSAVGID